jgi:hypothetical protein
MWQQYQIDLSACGGLAKKVKIKNLRSRNFKECVSDITESLSVPGTRHTDRKILFSGTTGDKTLLCDNL